MQEINESFNGKSVDVKVQEEFLVTLEEGTAITGFAWHLEDAGEPVCKLISDTRAAADNTTPEPLPAHAWRFRAVQAGKGTLSFRYRRSWETATPAARSFTVSIEVSGA